jgi:3-hydroxyacyl-CoA dehydrogenase/enoyl-CoA hydratase/3-hydroxybutyryl-CoA epimerase
MTEHATGGARPVVAGVIFGSGDAPFRGGPWRYERSLGLVEVMLRQRELEGRHGACFRPDPGWDTFGAGAV